MNTVVSVVIPVHNSGKFVPETVQSVINQSYDAVEIILVDDGSKDEETIRVLKELGKEHQVLFEENAGVSEARNKGIAAAKGKYILPLDSDDIIKPTFIEKCVKALDEDPSITVVRTAVELFGKRSGIMPLGEYDFSVLLNRNLMVVTSMFKKEDWAKVGGFDSNFVQTFEDWDFWICLLKNGGKVYSIDEPLFKYRIRTKSRNHSVNMGDFKELRRKIWEKHKEQYALHFTDPMESFEYQMISQSKANKLGNLLLAPFNSLKLIK